jgi:PAT family beta-lactamase induction signal transducer AmpG
MRPLRRRRRWNCASSRRLGGLITRGPLGRALAFLSDAVVAPFVDFFARNGREALLILLLISLYKLSDITMGVMANPFYLDLGFSKTDIADVTKIFGFFMTIAGAALGGVLVVRFGIARPLVLGAVLVALTNLLFAGLAVLEPSLALLAVVVSADNLSGGIAAAVFIAYLSSLTNQAYTATQYALFSSLMTLPAKVIGGFSGVVVDAQGYMAFFLYAGLLGIPAILLSLRVLRQPPVASPIPWVGIHAGDVGLKPDLRGLGSRPWVGIHADEIVP